MRISIFPLSGAILFPGLHLPLHVITAAIGLQATQNLAVKLVECFHCQILQDSCAWYKSSAIVCRKSDALRRYSPGCLRTTCGTVREAVSYTHLTLPTSDLV